MNQVFRYQAKNSSGEIVRGTLRADSEAQAYRQLTVQGFFPMVIELEKTKAVEEANKFSINKYRWVLTHKVSVRELAGFFDHFAILLSSGFPLLRSLELVKRQAKNPVFANALSQIIKDIQGGMKLSESISNFPTIFPPTAAGVIQAGEASGKLDVILAELAKSYESEAELRAKVGATLVYPAFVCCFGIVTVFFVMTFIVPKLLVFFESWEHPLPLPTKILLGLSTLFTHGLGIGLFVFLGLIVFLWSRLSREKKMSLLSVMTKAVPFIQSLLFLSDFVPLARTWSLLLKSGVPILESIRICQSVVASAELKKSLKQISERMAQGSSLTDSLTEKGMFPELALSFLSVGEESGNLGTAFEKVAQYYERELDQKLKVITTLLEPVLILVIGLGICFIVLSLLLPIFEINMLAQ